VATTVASYTRLRPLHQGPKVNPPCFLLFPVKPTGSKVEGRLMRVNDLLRVEFMAECLGKWPVFLIQERPWSPSSSTILPQQYFVLSKILAPVQRMLAIRSSSEQSRSDIWRLHHKCNRLWLLATCLITVTNKQNHNVIDYNYIESNQDYNRDYICLETSPEQKQTPFAWFDVNIFSDNIRYECSKQIY